MCCSSGRVHGFVHLTRSEKCLYRHTVTTICISTFTLFVHLDQVRQAANLEGEDLQHDSVGLPGPRNEQTLSSLTKFGRILPPVTTHTHTSHIWLTRCKVTMWHCVSNCHYVTLVLPLQTVTLLTLNLIYCILQPGGHCTRHRTSYLFALCACVVRCGVCCLTCLCSLQESNLRVAREAKELDGGGTQMGHHTTVVGGTQMGLQSTVVGGGTQTSGAP